MSAAYRWKIDKDYLEERIESVPYHGAVGVEGPSDLDESLVSNPQGFTMYDDDDEAYYHGWLYGDYAGFEPVDDFGMPNAGAVHIKFDGDTDYL